LKSSLPLGVTVLKETVDQDETRYLERGAKISWFLFWGPSCFHKSRAKEHIPSAEQHVSLMWNLFM